MHSTRQLLAAFFAACFLAVAAFAADASPTGTWKWTQQSPQGGEGLERKVTLELKDGKVTGKLHAGKSPFGEFPDAPIKDGTFKEGVVAFSVTREIDGNSFTLKYSGKVDGDTIKGSMEFPGFNGGDAQKVDWEAKREK